jgi:hypothetical protein
LRPLLGVLKELTDFIKSVARSAQIHNLTLAMSQPGALVPISLARAFEIFNFLSK